ncbi:MAG: class I SAM-dependent methyltransferase [Gammaproteobacteria bacterium]
MEETYLRQYRDLFERHWWWRARREILLREINRTLPTRKFQRILDVGCGDGLFFPYLSHMGEVEGIEPETSLVTERGRRWGPIHTVPFDERFQPAKRFTLILFLDVLEHLPDPVAALRHATRLLDTNGRIFMTLPAFRVLWTAHDEINSHRDRYTRRSLRRLAYESGIHLTDQRYLFHWLFPVKLGLRLVEAMGLSKGTLPEIPPRPINELLRIISQLEYRTLRSFGLPLGTTLLAVGRTWPGRASTEDPSG